VRVCVHGLAYMCIYLSYVYVWVGGGGVGAGG
jgi:hypothetical protein